MAAYGKDRERRWRERVDSDARRPDNWAAATARRCGLRVESTTEFRTVFRGRFAGSAIDVVRTRETIQTWSWLVTVSRAGLDASIVLQRETAVSRAKRALGRFDVETGAEGFDEAVYVGGDTTHMLGALNGPTRVGALDLVTRGGRVRNGSCQFTRRTNRPDATPERLMQDFRTAAKLLRRLSGTTDEARSRMIENATDERNISVRIANLDRLRATYPDDVGRLDWRVDQALDSRIAWRMALMSRRVSISDLGRWATSEDLTVRDRAAFLEALERRLPDGDALGVIESQLRGPLGGAALRVLLRRIDHAPTMRDVTSSTLVKLMSAAGTADRVRLARTLAEAARADAIPILVQYASGLFHPRELKDAVRRAIANIEEKTNRHRGHLSVTVPAEDGRLSVATEGGDLSVADD